MQQVAILTVILRLRVAVKVEVETDLVEYSGDDLLLDRLRVRRVCMLVRAPPARIRRPLRRLDSERYKREPLFRRAQGTSLASYLSPVAFGIQVVLDNSLGL